MKEKAKHDGSGFMEHSEENMAHGVEAMAHSEEIAAHGVEAMAHSEGIAAHSVEAMAHSEEIVTHDGKSAVQNEQEWQKLADFFKIMGDKTRVSILSVLLKREMCVKDIYQELGLNTSMVSHQLKILRAAKIAKARREGKNVFYSLDDGHMEQIISVALEHIRHDEAHKE